MPSWYDNAHALSLLKEVSRDKEKKLRDFRNSLFENFVKNYIL